MIISFFRFRYPSCKRSGVAFSGRLHTANRMKKNDWIGLGASIALHAGVLLGFAFLTVAQADSRQIGFIEVEFGPYAESRASEETVAPEAPQETPKRTCACAGRSQTGGPAGSVATCGRGRSGDARRRSRRFLPNGRIARKRRKSPIRSPNHRPFVRLAVRPCPAKPGKRALPKRERGWTN